MSASISPVCATTIEWAYEPASFFEEPFSVSDPAWELRINTGKATAKLATPSDPVSPATMEEIEFRLKSILDCREITAHKSYRLRAPATYQHRQDGSRSVTAQITGQAAIVTMGKADVVVRDQSGRVVHDTRRERIDTDEAFIRLVSPAMRRSPELTSLVRSYGKAVSDPADELIHLYEIVDCLAKHYGSEKVVPKTLGVSKTKWGRLRRLANAEPLAQGRHRGKHLPTRPATQAELGEARETARTLIAAFARTV